MPELVLENVHGFLNRVGLFDDGLLLVACLESVGSPDVVGHERHAEDGQEVPDFENDLAELEVKEVLSPPFGFLGGVHVEVINVLVRLLN